MLVVVLSKLAVMFVFLHSISTPCYRTLLVLLPYVDAMVYLSINDMSFVRYAFPFFLYGSVRSH